MNIIWIASFPRSGNTFFRNILFHVYGINSLENEDEIESSLDGELKFVKTHLMPFQLKKYNRKIQKVVYLVRDGRDSICSDAFKRKNLIDGSSDIYTNFKEATHAKRGAFFGGWSNNCRLWLAEKPIVIRFEDLIKKPKEIFTVLEKELNLPKPNWDELPTFEKQKEGKTKHGSAGENNTNETNFSEKFFRKGEVGNWRQEMPKEFQELYWLKHASVMESFGYSKEGGIGEVNYKELDRIASMKVENFKIAAIQYYWDCRLKLSHLKNTLVKK